MRRIRLLAVLATVSTSLGGVATAGTAAASAPPSNDTFAGAKVVPSLPFSDTVDTTGATSGPADAQLNASNPACSNPFGPTLNKTVWYKFTAGSDGALGVDARASSYSVGVVIATGTPGALSALTCGLGVAATATVSGTTYWVNASDLFANTGGTLDIDFVVPPPPPTLNVTASGGTVDRSGAATITFAYSCTNATSGDGFVSLTQTVGRFAISGSGLFFDAASCDGTQHTWSTTVPASNGKFSGGKAALIADLEVCGELQCVSAPELTPTIQLHRNG
ncbi:MAG: hypothetical protein QOE94_1713 [Mycobacterium sp.]|nr:hypothetical protein [Mycobacterium sp.]